jgi:hypothetical protein
VPRYARHRPSLKQSFAETKTATQSALYVFRARRADWVKLIWQIPLAKRKELSVSVGRLPPPLYLRDQGGEGDEHSRQSANGAGVHDTSLDFVLIEREPQLRVAILIKLLQWVSSG